MPNEKEVLELAEECGATIRNVNTLSGHTQHISFVLSDFNVFADALDVKMKAEGWRQCAKGQGETQHCAQAVELQAQIVIKDSALDKLARLGNEPHFGNSIGNVIAQEAISTTQQSSAAFLAEVRAKALEDAKCHLIKMGEEAIYPKPVPTFDEAIRQLECMAAEFRNSAAQPEGKE